MSANDSSDQVTTPTNSFFEQEGVELDRLEIGSGVPVGIQRVSNPEVGIGGAFGTWGEAYDNKRLPELIERRMGVPLSDEEKMELTSLGFTVRHHIQDLTDEEHEAVEIEVGRRLLTAAAQASGWSPEDVEGVLVGMSGPISNDYTEKIARAAGIPESALKVSVHKACDSSVSALHNALNPDLSANHRMGVNIAEELKGKKILVGGIEGLSRFTRWSHDHNAMQLFGNGAGAIGVIPGESMQLLVGVEHEVFDNDGVLAVHMYYPHTKKPQSGDSRVEVSMAGDNHIRLAGMMHEPEDGSPVVMAGPMGMVKLFVRTGVDVVQRVYYAYQSRMSELGMTGKSIAVTTVHHANLKINRLKEKHLQREGINIPMPWVLSEFGNVSAASNMIAFLRQLPGMRPSDHVLIDGFGAGTYYDTMVVSLGGL